MTRPLLIVGAGGHARVLLDALRESGGHEVLGFTDANPAKWSQIVAGLPVLGDDRHILDSHPPERVELVNGLGSTGDTTARRRAYEFFQAIGYRFASVVHPRAFVSRAATLGEGVQVMAGAMIQTGAHVGENALINTAAVVDHDCEIGAHTHIAPGATLSGGVRVKPGAHIGTGASVVQGVSIGLGALVAAGAVVVHDVADGVKVVGVPAREQTA